MAAETVAWQALTAAALFAALALAGAQLSREPTGRRLGLDPGRLGPAGVGRAIAGMLGLSHAADAALSLGGWRGSPGLRQLDEALSGLSGLGPADLWFPLAALALAAACAEELFFRGLVQRGLARRLGAPAAVGLSALLFGAVHGDAAHGAAAFALGLYLGVLAVRADSIRPCMAAHAVNNAAAVLEAAAGLEVPAGEIPALAGGLALAAWGLWPARGRPAA